MQPSRWGFLASCPALVCQPCSSATNQTLSLSHSSVNFTPCKCLVTKHGTCTKANLLVSICAVSTWITLLLVAALQEAVVLWEELRPKQTTKEQKQQLVAQIVKKVRWVICRARLHCLPSCVRGALTQPTCLQLCKCLQPEA